MFRSYLFAYESHAFTCVVALSPGLAESKVVVAVPSPFLIPTHMANPTLCLFLLHLPLSPPPRHLRALPKLHLSSLPLHPPQKPLYHPNYVRHPTRVRVQHQHKHPPFIPISPIFPCVLSCFSGLS